MRNIKHTRSETLIAAKRIVSIRGNKLTLREQALVGGQRRMVVYVLQIGNDPRAWSKVCKSENLASSWSPCLYYGLTPFVKQSAIEEAITEVMNQLSKRSYLVSKDRINRIRVSNSDLIENQQLRKTVLKLRAWSHWLELIPTEAYDLVKRFELPVEPWLMICLWVRVPAGHELFEDVPLLAYIMTKPWKFKALSDSQRKHRYRVYRSLVTKRRRVLLAWLGFPGESSMLAVLRLSINIPFTHWSQVEGHFRCMKKKETRQYYLASHELLSADHLFLLSYYRAKVCLMKRLVACDNTRGNSHWFLIYKDSIGMGNDCIYSEEEKSLNKTRLQAVENLKELKTLHDELSERQNLTEIVSLEEKYQNWHVDFPPITTTNNVKGLCSVEEVVKEGRAMKHCLAQYLGRMVAGEYFAYHAEVDGEHATVGLKKMPHGQWVVDQIYGKMNQPSSDRLVNFVHQWLKERSRRQ